MSIKKNQQKGKKRFTAAESRVRFAYESSALSNGKHVCVFDYHCLRAAPWFGWPAAVWLGEALKVPRDKPLVREARAWAGLLLVDAEAGA